MKTRFAVAAMLLLASAFGAAAPIAGGGLEQTAERSNPTVDLVQTRYRGRPAVRVSDRFSKSGLVPIVRLSHSDFHNGTIEALVAGTPAPGSDPSFRGFIGIAFRVQADPSRYEAFYIRPTNGRAEDQLRRNHSTQYIGMPHYGWQRLRRESPGVYESYADMIAGEWTRLRIEVNGGKARLYVGEAEQPALIVNDLKNGSDSRGGVALWIGPGTFGYFSDVRVRGAAD